MNTYFIGDGCLCYSLGETIDRQTSKRILSIYRKLKAMPPLRELGVLDLVPSYNALALHFDPATARLEEIEATLAPLLHDTSPPPSCGGQRHILPVTYAGEDLLRVAEINDLTLGEVIRIHQAPDYTVAMVGFLPHFPYLIGLDPRLETPRLKSPRKRVPAGAVGIGGAQAGVYPSESPGGWNLIGATDPEQLLAIQPGDTIRFKEV